MSITDKEIAGLSCKLFGGGGTKMKRDKAEDSSLSL